MYENVKHGTQIRPVHINSKALKKCNVDENPYKLALSKDVDDNGIVEPLLEMRKCDLTWSILSTSIDYTTDEGDNPYVDMNRSNVYKKLSDDEQLVIEDSSDQWDERFEEVTCNLRYTHKFDDTSDISTTYLGKYTSRDDPRTFPTDNHIPFDGKGMATAYLSDGSPMKIFFDSGASRSYLSKRFYDNNPMLHKLPQFVTTCAGIRIGKGTIVQALFVIPILFMSNGHIFEIFTIVAEIDDEMDLVFGFKNMTETEGMLNTRTGEYDFIGRSIPVFPMDNLDVPAGEKAYVKFKAPFCDKLSGMICTKFFSKDRVYTMRIKIQDNKGVVQFGNGSDKIAKLRKNQAIGLLDLRSIGYFKVGYQKMVIMAESSKAFQMYHYKQMTKESADSEDSFMRATCLERDTQDPMLKKLGDTATSKYRKDPYPWLDVDDPRRFQSDEEILYENIDCPGQL